MVIGSWAAAVCLIALYYARGLPAILTTSAVNGFANALYSPAATALIADVPPPRDRIELTKMATQRLGKDVVDLLDAGFDFDEIGRAHV